MSYFAIDITADRRQKLIDQVALVLTLACSFFSPWGSGLQNLPAFDYSKIFVVLAAIFIFFWFTCQRQRFTVFPRYFNYFIIFVAVHTFITYVVFCPQELELGYKGEHILANELVMLQENQGMGIARYFLFVAFTYALARQLTSENRLVGVALAYGAGLAVTVLLRGASASDVSRFSGGSLNANTFAATALTGLFLSFYVVSLPRVSQARKLLGLVFAAIALYGVIFSVSRGVMIAMIFGIAVFLFFMPDQKTRLLLASFLILVCIIATVVIPKQLAQTPHQRLAPQAILQDRASGRLTIWQDYLRQFPQYALVGIGKGRSQHITALDFSTEKWRATHSEYLGVLVELGLPGLILLVVALYQLWRQLLIIRPQQKRIPSDAVILGLIAAWTLMFVFGRYGTRSLWITFAVVAAYGALRSQRQTINVCDPCFRNDVRTDLVIPDLIGNPGW